MTCVFQATFAFTTTLSYREKTCFAKMISSHLIPDYELICDSVETDCNI